MNDLRAGLLEQGRPSLLRDLRSWIRFAVAVVALFGATLDAPGQVSLYGPQPSPDDSSTNAPAASSDATTNSTGTSLYTPGTQLDTPEPSPGGATSDAGGTSLYTPGASLYTPGASLYNTGITLTPGVEVKETEKVIKIRLRGDILFDFDKWDIRPSAETTLHQIATLIQKYPHAVVRIAGFTDSKGSETYNLGLSDRRATSVKHWLEAHGVPGHMMATKGFGAAHPVAANTNSDGSDNPDGRQQNRRVELEIKKN